MGRDEDLYACGEETHHGEVQAQRQCTRIMIISLSQAIYLSPAYGQAIPASKSET